MLRYPAENHLLGSCFFAIIRQKTAAKHSHVSGMKPSERWEHGEMMSFDISDVLIGEAGSTHFQRFTTNGDQESLRALLEFFEHKGMPEPSQTQAEAVVRFILSLDHEAGLSIVHEVANHYPQTAAVIKTVLLRMLQEGELTNRDDGHFYSNLAAAMFETLVVERTPRANAPPAETAEDDSRVASDRDEAPTDEDGINCDD